MKTALILIGILALIGIGFVLSKGVGVYRVSDPKSDRVVREGWRTHDFKDKPFSFDYPAGWSAEEVEPGLLVVSEKPDANDAITVNVAGDLSYERAVDEIASQLATSTMQTVTVAGLPGVRFTGRLLLDLEEESGRDVIFTMLDHGGRLVSIDIVVPKVGGRELLDAYEEILKSFRRAPTPI